MHSNTTRVENTEWPSEKFRRQKNLLERLKWIGSVETIYDRLIVFENIETTLQLFSKNKVV